MSTVVGTSCANGKYVHLVPMTQGAIHQFKGLPHHSQEISQKTKYLTS